MLLLVSFIVIYLFFNKTCTNKGVYRIYFKIGNYGIKLARLNFTGVNGGLCFLCGIIMNVLEYKRYQYYCKHKTYIQDGKLWNYSSKDIIHFCPCYFTCGLFSVYRHIPEKLDNKDFYKESIDYWKKLTGYMVADLKPENFRKDVNTIFCVDYADFSVVNSYTRQSIQLIDYK